jgi:hypothetical protein
MNDVIEARPGQLYIIEEIRNERISQAVSRAVRAYLGQFGVGPQYVFLRGLPNGVVLGYVIRHLGWEILLLQADWVPDGRVAVGEPGTQIGTPSERFEAEELPAPMVLRV